jgi:hypothetical protein
VASNDALALFELQAQIMILEFTTPASITGWQPIDDRIMGGVSRSRFGFDPAGHAVFEGLVSPDNGGGFASVRHGQIALGSPNTTVYRLTVLGDGKRYKLNLRTDTAPDGVNYQAVFQPQVGVWVSLDLPVAQFVPRFRGRDVAGMPPLAPARVCQLGLMIGDRQWGRFCLFIRSIEAATPQDA